MNLETEKGFMQAVIDLARLQGWLVYHPFDSRRSQGGYFDLTMMRDGRLIFAELKSQKGRMRADQREWRKEAEKVESASYDLYRGTPMFVRYFLWRPSDWSEIEQVLQREED